jgi:predicted dehydrogenase
VDICTPTALHSAQVIAALKAGKHVLCEKPLAQTAADARKVLKAAAVSKKFLMPAMCMRFWPGWNWLKKVIAERTYGEVRAANFRRLSAMPAWGTAGVHTGGALFDLHIHDTDFVNFLFGRPKSVFSTGVIGKGGAINHVVTQYHFPGGPAVGAEGSWLLAQGFRMGFTMLCERATLDFDLARGAGALRVDEAGKKSRTIKLESGDGYDAEIRYFVGCVARDERPETVTARDALTALEICEAEEKSVRSGRLVKI